MGKRLVRSFSAAVLSFIIGFFWFAEATADEEKLIDIQKIFRTNYSLGGDTLDVKRKEEAIYLSKGDINGAVATLKNIIIENKAPIRSFKPVDSINLIIFRGVLPVLGKIEVTKAVFRDKHIEVYAKYIDIPEINVPSQPAVVIPLGKLPKGKYTVSLLVDSQLRKETSFIVK